MFVFVSCKNETVLVSDSDDMELLLIITFETHEEIIEMNVRNVEYQLLQSVSLQTLHLVFY